jgi:hypothetical protein
MWTLLFGGPDWMPITPKTGSFLHADSQPARPIADHLAIGCNEAAGPPLTHLQHATQMSDSFSLRSGPYH